MANFAFINSQNIVIGINSINNSDITINNSENEQLGIDFLTNEINITTIYPNCVLIRQTSYNSNFRNKYAGLGDTWDETNNVFISPKPFDDWTLVDFKWTAPIPYPNDGNHYVWKNGDWEEIITGALN
jgi:hypothetical protein